MVVVSGAIYMALFKLYPSIPTIIGKTAEGVMTTPSSSPARAYKRTAQFKRSSILPNTVLQPGAPPPTSQEEPAALELVSSYIVKFRLDVSVCMIRNFPFSPEYVGESVSICL